DAIKAISENCPKLQQLSLAGCDWLTTDEVMFLVTRCRQLYNLDLSRCGKLDGRLSKHLVVRNEMVPREFFDSAGMSLADAGIRVLGGPAAYEAVTKRLSSISTTVPPISMSDLDVPLSDLVGMPWSPKTAKGTPVDDYPYQYTDKVRVRDGAMLDLVRSIISDHPSRTNDSSSQVNSSSSSSQGFQSSTFGSSSSSSSDGHAQDQLTQQWQLQYNQQQLRQLQHHYRFHREQTRQETHGLSFFELLTATLEDGSQQTDEGASVGESSSSHHTHDHHAHIHTHTHLGDIAESSDWGNTLLVVGSTNDGEDNNEQDHLQEELFEL
ncbi:hypothetical protein BGZ81_011148, partial [Podila clonocystis]